MRTLDIDRLTLRLTGVSPVAAHVLARAVAGRLSKLRFDGAAAPASLHIDVRARRGEPPEMLSARIADEIERTLKGVHVGR
jgi:hypothetical protein